MTNKKQWEKDYQDMKVIVHDNRWDENLDIIEVEYHDDKVAIVCE